MSDRGERLEGRMRRKRGVVEEKNTKHTARNVSDGARHCCCEYTCSALSSSVTLSGGSERAHKHNKQQHRGNLPPAACGWMDTTGVKYVTVVEGKEREGGMERDGGSFDFRQQLLGFNFARGTGGEEKEEKEGWWWRRCGFLS